MMHAEQTATEASPELRILLVEDNEHDRVAFFTGAAQQPIHHQRLRTHR